MVATKCFNLPSSKSVGLPILVNLVRLISSGKSGLVYYFPSSPAERFLYLSDLGYQSSMESFGVKNYPVHSKRRPEAKVNVLHPNRFYTDNETNNYISKPRNIQTQLDMTKIGSELLSKAIHRKRGTDFTVCILNIGCGNIALNSIETYFKRAHFLVGVDLSENMLNSVSPEPMKTGQIYDLVQADIQNLSFFKPLMFDGVISISTLQWLLWTDVKRNDTARLSVFMKSMWYCLKHDSPVICQFYPKSLQDLYHIVNVTEELKLFHGAILCCQPHQNKAKKLFLCLHKI